MKRQRNLINSDTAVYRLKAQYRRILVRFRSSRHGTMAKRVNDIATIIRARTSQKSDKSERTRTRDTSVRQIRIRCNIYNRTCITQQTIYGENVFAHRYTRRSNGINKIFKAVRDRFSVRHVLYETFGFERTRAYRVGVGPENTRLSKRNFPVGGTRKVARASMSRESGYVVFKRLVKCRVWKFVQKIRSVVLPELDKRNDLLYLFNDTRTHIFPVIGRKTIVRKKWRFMRVLL